MLPLRNEPQESSLRPQRDWYDVGELVREVVGRLQRALHGRPVRVSVADGLPPESLDYLMIDQVVTNLIENALKYTPSGSPLDVRVESAPGRIRIVVADHGPGIPAAERTSIFDKFHRLEQRSTIKGSGLGLAVSKGLVEAHDGRIWVEETPGGGATLVVELPVTRGGPGDPTAGGSATPGGEDVASAAGQDERLALSARP